MLLLSQPPIVPGLQACSVTPGLGKLFNFVKLQVSDWKNREENSGVTYNEH